jgi:hypothetical protein
MSSITKESIYGHSMLCIKCMKVASVLHKPIGITKHSYKILKEILASLQNIEASFERI